MLDTVVHKYLICAIKSPNTKRCPKDGQYTVKEKENLLDYLLYMTIFIDHQNLRMYACMTGFNVTTVKRIKKPSLKILLMWILMKYWKWRVIYPLILQLKWMIFQKQRLKKFFLL